MRLRMAALLFIVILTQESSARGGGGRGSGGRGGRSRGRSSFRGRSTGSIHGAGSFLTNIKTYHPPRHINYKCKNCGSYTSYPVYQSQPPKYVSKFWQSGTGFGRLLSGLALYNLGRASRIPAMLYHSRNNEDCSFQMTDQEHFEETRIPCFIISTFMERESERKWRINQMDITTNIDISGFIDKGWSFSEVTAAVECVIWRNVSRSNIRYEIPCDLLKEYAETLEEEDSFSPYIPLLIFVVFISLIYAAYSYSEQREKNKYLEASIKTKEEDAVGKEYMV